MCVDVFARVPRRDLDECAQGVSAASPREAGAVDGPPCVQLVALMWLTKDGVQLATKGYSDDIAVPGAPSIKDLHGEYIDKGGRFFACPVCVKTHGLEAAE